MNELLALNLAAFSHSWHRQASELLLWRGQPVRLASELDVQEGILIGIGRSGELILQTPRGSQRCTSGDLLPL